MFVNCWLTVGWQSVEGCCSSQSPSSRPELDIVLIIRNQMLIANNEQVLSSDILDNKQRLIVLK